LIKAEGLNLAVSNSFRSLVLPLFGLLLLSGCASKRGKTATVPSTQPPRATIPGQRSDQNNAAQLIRKSVAQLKQSLTALQSSVPDAVLNRTRCFLLIPAQERRGLSICRGESDASKWTVPSIFSFEGQVPTTTGMLFVLSDRVPRAFEGGTVDLSIYSAIAGKTTSEAPLLTDRELAFDIVSYSVDGRVAGAPLPTRRLTIGNSASIGTTEVDQYQEWVQSYFNTITPTGIIIHHSAMLPGTKKVLTNVNDIDSYHAGRGFDTECFGQEYHVAYHFLIKRNGQIKAGRPERCQGAHARAYNSYIGISLLGDFSSKESSSGPTPQQLKSLVELTKRLQHRYKIPVQRILRHSDVASTECPGDRFPFRAFLLSLMNGTAGAQ
jgi:hypothetical protein